ncbi:immunoglobulin-like domain-containing protein, partial [Vibrio splendidus]|uniref:immunoglobulin-like domain-containing protein n=2 Tax=Vibrio splendidus TaxID=29497 RepID=UPI0030B846F8
MSLTADASVTEGGTITYTATLTSAAASDVTVTLSNNETITIYAKGTELADGSIADGLSGSVEVTASDDVYVGGDSASVTITDATGGNFEDLVKDSTPANTTITDDSDETTVSLTADASVTEGGTIT